MARRTVTVAAFSVGIAGALWVGASLMGYHSCGKWTPLSCGGADPELTALIR